MKEDFGTDIFVSKSNIGKAKNGYKVVVSNTNILKKEKMQKEKLLRY